MQANNLKIRPSNINDSPAIIDLYRNVAQTSGGIARLASEVTDDYVKGFLHSIHQKGIGLVAIDDDQLIIAEIHAYSPGIQVFSHVLSDLTIAVHPDYQGAGIGRKIFSSFLKKVTLNHLKINRVELFARESNKKVIAFYQSLGFKIEGRFINRIKNADGSFSADIPMAWHRP